MANKNDFTNWAAIAAQNNLLFDNEKTSIPFTVQEVYEGTNRWATILKRGREHMELSFGLRPLSGNPSHIDVAKDAETIVPKLARQGRGKYFWRRVEVNAEIVINRNNSGVQLSLPPSFFVTLRSPDVLKSLLPLGLAVLGGIVSALAAQGFNEILRTTLKALAPAATIFLVVYLIAAALHWMGSRSDIKWVLGKE